MLPPVRTSQYGRTTAGSSLAVKVPAIGGLFWVAKILTTGTGEAASDYLAKINLVVAGLVGVVGFGVAMWFQLRARRYVAGIYWFAVAMVALFGTMAADGLHIALRLPYAVTTIGYAVALALILWAWWRSEGTLSIHSITTRRRECFYWLTVLATFALGTAAGDLTAVSMHLGYLASGLFFAAVFAIPAVGWRLGLNPVFAFWSAYVITRPLGASFADWIGKPSTRAGGLGAGDGTVTIIGTALIVAIVSYFAVTGRDLPPETDDAEAEAGLDVR